MAGKRRDAANEWHGHRIITEEELIRAQHRLADEPAYRSVRLRQQIVIGLLASLLVFALIGAYLVNNGTWVIPAFEPRPAAQAPAGVASCPVEEFDAPEPREVRINVLNASGTPGLAGATATLLKKRDFRIGATGNQVLANPAVIAVIRSGPGGYAQALSVQRQIKGSVFLPDAGMSGSAVDLVLGTKYKRMLKPAQVKTGPGKLVCPKVKGPAKKSPAPKDPAKPKPSGTKDQSSNK